MTVIISGFIDFQSHENVPEILRSARALVEGALAEEGCIAYSWTEDHLTPGRVMVYEEWTTSEALSAHLASHWYRDMGQHLAKFDRLPMVKAIKKYRVDLEEPVYDETGVARGAFSTS
ncbi:MAG: antibiotic biosynthesis monooxygenase [Pseudomonadales bacterium]|nr:antibiotic biosynthesis monooxygenase [Pseudomonadales bacterium]